MEILDFVITGAVNLVIRMGEGRIRRVIVITVCDFSLFLLTFVAVEIAFEGDPVHGLGLRRLTGFHREASILSLIIFLFLYDFLCLFRRQNVTLIVFLFRLFTF